jgi:hypothetical protein
MLVDAWGLVTGGKRVWYEDAGAPAFHTKLCLPAAASIDELNNYR